MEPLAQLPGPVPALRAAGGVVHRSDAGSTAIAVVHRPRYDDWSLPKGKARPGETALATAAREVREEIGSRAGIQARLGSTMYPTDRGSKLVEYFVMRDIEGSFEPNDEVDEVRWLSPQDAADSVTHSSDREMIERFADLPALTATIALVRHAHAGKRSAWALADDLRPLSPRGARQAAALAPALSSVAPNQIISGPPVRCVATVAPLSDLLGIPTDVRVWAGDAAFDADPSATINAVLHLRDKGISCVLSSQGLTIPALLEELAGPTADYETAKAGFWILSFAGAELVTVDRHSPPQVR